MGNTRKIMLGVTTTALTLGLTGCSSSSVDLPPQPTDGNCDDWDWDDEQGVWVCDDDSTYRGHYYYGGRYYKDKNSLLISSDYEKYKNSASFKGGTQSSSGFGSGSKSYGG